MSPYAEHVILPLLAAEVRRRGKPIGSGIIGDLLGKSRRQIYNYLRELESAQKAVRASAGGKRWGVGSD